MIRCLSGAQLGRHWDVIDIHEEPYALCTTEILVLRWLRRQRAPFVLYSAQNIFKRYPGPFRWMERWALRNAAALSVCNEDAARIAVRKGFIGRIAHIPLGLDTSRFSPSSDETAEVRENLVVGYVGRLEAHKGVKVLLDAIAGDDSMRVRIAGGGPEEDDLRRRAGQADLRNRVEFFGHLGQEELSNFYRGLDALAVPSLDTSRWLEQFCRVAVEAMASGVPVVASRSGALPDVIGRAGLLVSPGDPAALRAALRLIATHPDLAEQLRHDGVTRAAEFSWGRVGADYVHLYEEIADLDDVGHSTAPEDGDHRTTGPSDAGLEVVIVAFGAPDLFARALAPIARRYLLTVVDNSADPAIKAITEAADGRYLDPGGNLGFGAGVNHALLTPLSPGSDVLLLNPDAVIDAEGIDQLHKHLRADRGLASVGPAQVDGSGRPARVEWPFPSPWRAWLEAVGLGRVSAAATYIIGSVLLIRWDALEAIGGFDDRFFLYAEETDWAYRAHRAGWSHEMVESVTALHLGAGTGGDPVLRETLFHSSNELYLRKHFGATGWRIAQAGAVMGAAARSVALSGDRRRAARRRLRLYLHGPARQARRQPVS